MRRALALSIVLLAAAAAIGGEATYVVHCEALPEGRSVNGFVQRVRALAPETAEVEVVTSLAPIESRGFSAGQPQPSAKTPSWFRLPRSLDELLWVQNDPWERATRILRWVMEHVRLDVREQVSQDAGSVLARGSGRCSGLANAAAAMLEAAGFSARTVSGVLVSGATTVPHRWLECWLPGAGWVPTDPTLGLWVVTPRHLAWPGAVTARCTVKVIQISGDAPSGWARAWGWPVRWNRGAVLKCQVVGEPTTAMLMAELKGPDGELRQLSFDRIGRFAGLSPGRWFLTVRRGGEIVERCTLRLEKGKVVSFSIKLPGPGVG